MAIDVYWGSGSPYSWRVMLALEHKRLPYTSHLLSLDMQEHKSPHMLALNPRGRVPTLKDGDYVVFESLAILYYLDLKYPDPPLFGDSPEEGARDHARDLRIPGVHRRARDAHRARRPVRGAAIRSRTKLVHSMHVVAGEARTIEMRLSKGDWIVGENRVAADYRDLSRHQIAAARAGASRSARAVVALPARRSELSRRSRAGSSASKLAGIRANLSAALARLRPADDVVRWQHRSHG